MRAAILLSTVLVVLTTVALAGASSAPPAPAAVFGTHYAIVELAVDENRAAVVTQPRGLWPGYGPKTSYDPCDGFGGADSTVVLWNETDGSFRRFPVPESIDPRVVLPPDHGPGCSAGSDLAIGDGRLVWVRHDQGLETYPAIESVSLTGGPVTEPNDGSIGYGPGGGFGEFHGTGPELFYNAYETCDVYRPDEGPCPSHGANRGILAGSASLVRILHGGLWTLKAGDSAWRLDAAGGGRIAVSQHFSVVVYTATGRRLATIPPRPRDRNRDVELSDRRLAIEHRSTLDLYVPGTGRRVRTYRLGTVARLGLAGLNSRFAVLRSRNRITLLQLATGRTADVPWPSGPGRTLNAVRLSQTGLFYAVDRAATSPGRSANGRIVYESNARLLARF